MMCVNCDNDVCEQAEAVGLSLCLDCLESYYIDCEVELAEMEATGN